MRAIDGDVLFREMEKAQWYNNADRDEIAEELVLNAPTIESRCEVCKAFNKTRSLIPQPERKKGKWIEQEDSWDGMYYECSACGEPWTTIDGTPWDNGMKFCPNCGASMMEGQDDSI